MLLLNEINLHSSVDESSITSSLTVSVLGTAPFDLDVFFAVK